MLPEQKSMLSSFFGKFARKSRRISTRRSPGSRRRMGLEQLEDRRLLVSRVFLDFGDGFAIPNNGPYALHNVLRGITPADFAGALIGGNGPGTNYTFSSGVMNGALAVDPDLDLVGLASLSLRNPAAPDLLNYLVAEEAITGQIRRALEPFDIQVISSYDFGLIQGGARFPTQNLGQASGMMNLNNTAGDVGSPGAGTATIPQFGSDDVYVYIVGLFQEDDDVITPFPVPISASFKVNIPSQAAKPNRTDAGAVIDANFWASQAALTGGSFSVAVANAALNAIGFGYGLVEIENGALGPTTLNYQDADTAFINQSSAMAETGFGLDFTQIDTVSPRFFNRFNMMQNGYDFQKLLRQGTLGNPNPGNPPPFPIEPGTDPNFFGVDIITVNSNPLKRVNLYDVLASDSDIGRNPDVQYVSGTGAFDRISIKKSGNKLATITVSAYRDAAFTSLMQTQSYTVSLSKLVIPGRLSTSAAFRLIVEGCNNDDIISIDPTLGCEVVVHGGAGITMLNVKGDGKMKTEFTPSAIPTILFNGIQPAGVGALKIMGSFGTTTLRIDDFNTLDGSALRIDNFASLKYRSPGYLDSNISITRGTAAGDVWNVSGQVVTTGAVSGSLLMTRVKQLNIDTTLGPSNDLVTVATDGAVATGLNGVTISLGAGNDALVVDESTSLENVSYSISPTLVLPTTPSTPLFKGFIYSGAETLNVEGAGGATTFLVTPSRNTTMLLNGNSVAPELTTLAVRLAGTTGGPNPPPPGPAGAYTFTSGHQPILFSGMDVVLEPVAAALVLANDGGGKPLVKVYDAETEDLQYMFYAYEQSFRGGVRVATADITADGVTDLVVVPGLGRAGTVKVYDGAQLALGIDAQGFVANPDAARIAQFSPEGSGYTNGFYVAVGDVDGDGIFDIVTSKARGTTRVRVFQGDGFGGFNRIDTFAPYGSGVSGALVAAGDMDGDGTAEIITVPGAGSRADVKIFDGDTHVRLRRFDGFEGSFRGGASLAVGDVDGDGRVEVILGAGGGGGSRVRIFDSNIGALRREFIAFSSNQNAALRVAAIDPDSFGIAQIYAVQTGSATTRNIRLFDPLSGGLVDQLLETNVDLRSGLNIGS